MRKNIFKGSVRYCIALLIAALMIQWIVPYPQAKTVQAPASCGLGCIRYDVVVIGSEIQGVLLAREAVKHGLDVIILDPRSESGGELVGGQMHFLDEPNDKNKKSLVQGEIKELFDGFKKGSIRKASEFNKYYNSKIKGISIKSGIEIESVKTIKVKGSQSLQSLTYLVNGKRHQVQANYWVENTDFNALTGKLDAKRIPGMESLYKPSYGQEPDYMAATLMLRFKKVDWRKLHQTVLENYPLSNVQKKYGPNTYVDWNIATGFSNIMMKYKPQDSQMVLRGMNTLDQGHGEVIMNALLIYDVDPSDEKSVKNALSKAKAEAPYVLEFMRKNIPGFAKADLNGFPEYLYIRDYNRYETEYVLKYEDVKNSRMFWDNVSIGGYSIDLQATRLIPKGIGFGKTDRYGMPLRSFELKSYDNVLVTGKNVGADVKAYGSARIMPNTALAAQTIGIILGREKGKNLNDLTPDDFRRIHAYLKKDYGIVLNK
ncbi:FAD-dependent oxidoreductase [Paenibacillus dakarensis]|uniref:FAD-dependent oxidoreductase n=1 Tax=Paenibacillus dakarensis TaxID=1527293 RepID=UPI0006D5AD6F|nr:FAD-dependent oxidoreductase [Paenibacillus dakarensis]